MTAYVEVYEGGKARIKVYDDKGVLDYSCPVDSIQVEMQASAIRTSGNVVSKKKKSLIIISGARN